MVKMGQGCSSAHQSRHGAVRCHWLHGSNEGRAQKPTQRHVVTVRCVNVHYLFILFKFACIIIIMKFSIINRDGGFYCILRK